jgi:hypothetical protein
MLPHAIDPGSRARKGAPTIEGDTEDIIYVRRAVKANGERRIRPEAQREQLVIDQRAVCLNRSAASGG